MPAPVGIENRPFWARILSLFCLAEIGLGLSFPATGVSWIGGDENGLIGALMGRFRAGEN